jgi:hypothetical protein
LQAADWQVVLDEPEKPDCCSCIRCPWTENTG